jgi:hypothetical protein
MRFVLAILVASSSLSACAEDVRAPVNVATRLYTDCVVSKFQTVRDITPTRVGVNEFVTEVDQQCLLWMLVWYQALMNQDLPDGDVSNRFNANRSRFLQSLTNAIRKEALR